MLKVGSHHFGTEDAQQIIAGYCFGLDADGRPHWAYRAYDCAHSDPATPLDAKDLLIPGALQAPLSRNVLANLLAVSPQASSEMLRIPRTTNFWDMPRHEIPTTVTNAPPGSAAALLDSARSILQRAFRTDADAIVHKIGYNKWRNQFPLMDRVTSAALPPNRWLTLHDDLTSAAAEWSALESWFVGQARSRGGISLTRLRLHDILLWCRSTGDDQLAQERGRDLLGA